MKVLYFAWLKERTGVSEEEVTPPESVTTLGDFIAWLKERSPGHAAALGDMSVLRAAVNQEMARPETPVGRDDEVAFFPPMTGGAG